MFLRCATRKKNGKEHRYWNLVENRRVAGGQVVQRQVLYLGEINDSQREVWRKSIEVLEDSGSKSAPRTYALFPEDRCEGVLPDESIVRLRLKSMQLCRPRQWGACWLALQLWQMLDLDVFWAERLPPSDPAEPARFRESIDILLGKQTPKITQHRHESLSVFGVGTELNRD